jgi:hypothetical protein
MERIVLERSVEQSRKQLEAIIQENIDLSTKMLLTNIAPVPPESVLATRLAATDKSIADVNDRLSKLEKVILEDPPKALEMPLLRNQLDALSHSYQSDIIAVRQEIAQVYDLNKWFIGLMFTMALGIIGLAVTNFIKVGKKGDE